MTTFRNPVALVDALTFEDDGRLEDRAADHLISRGWRRTLSIGVAGVSIKFVTATHKGPTPFVATVEHVAGVAGWRWKIVTPLIQSKGGEWGGSSATVDAAAGSVLHAIGRVTNPPPAHFQRQA